MPLTMQSLDAQKRFMSSYGVLEEEPGVICTDSYGYSYTEDGVFTSNLSQLFSSSLTSRSIQPHVAITRDPDKPTSALKIQNRCKMPHDIIGQAQKTHNFISTCLHSTQYQEWHPSSSGTWPSRLQVATVQLSEYLSMVCVCRAPLFSIILCFMAYISNPLQVTESYIRHGITKGRVRSKLRTMM